MSVISLIFVVTGALFIFAAAVGIGRFGDTMSRVHAVTKPQTIGLVFCLTGAIIKIVSSPDFGVSQRSDIGIVVLLVIFALLTSPVTAQRISRLARREGLYADDMLRNDRPAGKKRRKR
ncbi:monovalent cation/H+ antiporter subunit G [Corynebacterium phocae]|uniref:Monovalent cation/H+ antiporter subunit G n=1 Tax=Corynebacterium phocae TaxID=161895 RepID=A0A1L7D579_9CORY|nr:monovalent cation/H(+) antiporter subunit G [Corynebacterium phocae]APT93304.1 monovalent cation/H+ antiporter subunit G [Corynebacterium phocae]KAA8721633.1 cation:proton antiporter [Corynebacterium phocae]